MNIEEMRKVKASTELEILKLLNAFQVVTGTTVDNIDTRCIQAVGSNSEFVAVTLEVRL